MKTILYGHAWLSGALTGFAFYGFLRAFSTTPQVWVWVAVLDVGLLWTALGFSYVARRDSEGAARDDLEAPAPAPGGPSRRRGAPARHSSPVLMLLVFLAVAVLLAVAAGGWWSTTIRRPASLPFAPASTPPRPPPPAGRP